MSLKMQAACGSPEHRLFVTAGPRKSNCTNMAQLHSPYELHDFLCHSSHLCLVSPVISRASFGALASIDAQNRPVPAAKSAAQPGAEWAWDRNASVSLVARVPGLAVLGFDGFSWVGQNMVLNTTCTREESS